MSENPEPEVVANVEAEAEVALTAAEVDLAKRPLTREAYQYLKESGLNRHIRWDALVTLATAASRQLNLAEVSQTIASRCGRVVCALSGEEFDEPMVLVVRRDADPTLPTVPGLTPEMSAHVARTKAGNIRFQGASFIVVGENGEEEIRSYSGPLYFLRKNADGSVTPLWDRVSPLGNAMRAQKEVAEAALSEEEKARGAKGIVPLPLTRDHAETILAAKQAAKDRSARRRAEADEARESMKAAFSRARSFTRRSR